MNKEVVIVGIVCILIAWWIFFVDPFQASDGCALGILTGVAIGQMLWGNEK